MNGKEDLPPVLLGQRKFASSIPSGRISQYAPTEVPIISKKGAHGQTISMHDLTDPALIDQKLKSMSVVDSDARTSLEIDKRDKANLKFLRYKFNPGDKHEDGQNLTRSGSQLYGQLRASNHQKISINAFYESKNVLFQDDRAPLIYKKLFLNKESQR